MMTNKEHTGILQIISDLHVEFENLNKQNIKKYISKIININLPKKKERYLALLGDICCTGNKEDFAKYKFLLMNLTYYFDKIFVITGNHEYYLQGNNIPKSYNSTLQGINNKIKKFCEKNDKLIFLNNNFIKMKLGKCIYYIYGGTFWSKPKDKNLNLLREQMNDYTCIFIYDKKKKKIRKFTPFDMKKIHFSMINMIKKATNIAKTNKKKIIIFTHHKPYIDKNNEKNSIISEAYESDYDKYISNPPIYLWGYGHTHVHDEQKINKTLIISNPKGYKHQNNKINFKKNLKILLN